MLHILTPITLDFDQQWMRRTSLCESRLDTMSWTYRLFFFFIITVVVVNIIIFVVVHTFNTVVVRIFVPAQTVILGCLPGAAVWSISSAGRLSWWPPRAPIQSVYIFLPLDGIQLNWSPIRTRISFTNSREQKRGARLGPFADSCAPQSNLVWISIAACISGNYNRNLLYL